MSNRNQTPPPPLPGDEPAGHQPPEGQAYAATPALEPRKRSWFARHKVLTGLLGLLLFFALANAVGGEGESTESVPTQTSAESAGDSTEEGAGSSASSSGSTADESAAEEKEEEEAAAKRQAEQDAAAKEAEEEAAEKKAAEKKAEAEQAAADSLTVPQRNAVRSAENYLDFTAFSRSGLIDQLEFEGYSSDDATTAVDSLDVDYKEQAAKAAQNYLDMSGFSRSGLIDQLLFEGYSPEQAEYGVDQVGL